MIFAIELLVPVALAVLVVGEDWQRSSLDRHPGALALVVGGAFSLGARAHRRALLEAGPDPRRRSGGRARCCASRRCRTQSFWLDEAIAIDAARLDLGGLFDSLAHTEGNPPLYFMLARRLDARVRHARRRRCGRSRRSSGTATILLAYVIGRRLAAERVGLALAALVAFNPVLVWFSQEARPYALLVLLSGASFLFFAMALQRPTGKALAGWAAASAGSRSPPITSRAS